jgi:membrane associated rhomboid family serine protease
VIPASHRMDRILVRLERRFGRFAISNLTAFIVFGMAIVFVLAMSRQDVLSRLVLDMSAVRRGEVWRLVTYLFVPQSTSVLWIVFSLMWLWMLGSGLESEWGAFKLNVYYLLGMLGTTFAAVLTGHALGNYYLNLTLVFAFATLAPDYEVLLLVLPVKMKWLAWLSVAFLAHDFLFGDWAVRAAIVAAMGNYLLFFGPHLVALARGKQRESAQAARRTASRPAPAVAVDRACALCGAREGDGADIRVCACEKCKATGGPRTLCLEHARAH